jgi:hypothetical protein
MTELMHILKSKDENLMKENEWMFQDMWKFLDGSE